MILFVDRKCHHAPFGVIRVPYQREARAWTRAGNIWLTVRKSGDRFGQINCSEEFRWRKCGEGAIQAIQARRRCATAVCSQLISYELAAGLLPSAAQPRGGRLVEAEGSRLETGD